MGSPADGRLASVFAIRRLSPNTALQGWARGEAEVRGLEDGAVAFAVGWVLLGGALGQMIEDGAGLGELADPVLDVGEVSVDEVGDVFARRFAAVGDREYLLDLGEREPGGLGVADEPQPVADFGVVVPVTGRGAGRLGEETLPFPEANGLGGDAALVGDLPDAHPRTPLTFHHHGRFTIAHRNRPLAREKTIMKLELLYFDDCPNWKVAADRLDHVAGGRGLIVQRRLVTTHGEAEATRFRGSPTILVDGEDPFASGEEPFGLACRVYRTPDGPAGSPTIEQLEAVLNA